MSNFNYQKAYCVQAVPSFNSLPDHVRKAHSLLLPIVGELQQGRDLSIPLNDSILALLDELSTKEIAELSRSSHGVGDWHPSLLPRLFDNSKGESWKVSNCCDQVLRQRLGNTHKIEIHEGKLRVTFSRRDCWLWEEFALATHNNLATFKECGLAFGENTLHASAAKLSAEIGDLWPDVDTMETNDLYMSFLDMEQARQKKTIQDNFDKKIKDLKQSQLNAQKEVDFLLMCNEIQVPVDNVIYYSHTDTFCFGWRDPLSEKERKDIWRKLGSMRERGNLYKVDFNK